MDELFGILIMIVVYGFLADIILVTMLVGLKIMQAVLKGVLDG